MTKKEEYLLCPFCHSSRFKLYVVYDGDMVWRIDAVCTICNKAYKLESLERPED